MNTPAQDKKIRLPTGISLTPHGKYRAAICYKGIRKAVIKDTMEDAIRARVELMAEAQQEDVAQQEASITWTLERAFERTKVLRWHGAKSAEKLIRNAEEALDFFGRATLVTHITTDMVDSWVEELAWAVKNGDGTINRKLSALSAMLTVAKERGQLDRLPTIARRKERINRIVFFSLEEETEILTAFSYFGKEDHREASIILVETGFRPSELWGLEAFNVDLRNHTISLWKTKNNEARTIPMTKAVYEIMAVRCKKYPKGPLFPGSSNDWYGNGWEQVRAHLGRADDPNFIPYAWRHTCCSRLVQRGVPLLHVRGWMGHKSIQTTMRYAHLAPHDLLSLAKVLDGGEEARWWSIDVATPDTKVKQADQNKAIDADLLLQ